MAEQVPVPADVDVLDRVDYGDAFRARTAERRTAEEWIRRGMEGAPPALTGLVRVAQGRVLGLRLAPPGTPGHVLGWPIRHSAPDRIVLGTDGPLCTARIVLALEDGGAVLTTVLRYDHPAARPLWALVAPVHRRVARYLLDRTTGT